MQETGLIPIFIMLFEFTLHYNLKHTFQQNAQCLIVMYMFGEISCKICTEFFNFHESCKKEGEMVSFAKYIAYYNNIAIL